MNRPGCLIRQAVTELKKLTADRYEKLSPKLRFIETTVLPYSKGNVSHKNCKFLIVLFLCHKKQ